MNVAVLGSTGYAALELIRILLRHPRVAITALTTRDETGPRVSQVHPSLTGQLDLRCENLSPEQVAERAEFVFCALPHAASFAVVPPLLAAGARVVDLSADYRLSDPAVYREWYGVEHADAERMRSTVYGLPELFADRIPAANLVANPGCYTSTSILALAPLLAERAISPRGIVIDAKSGVSGAGRSLKQNFLYAECNESISAYGVGRHRHTPEIDEVLSTVAGEPIEVLFTPHLVPMDRGILCTIYAEPTDDRSEAAYLDLFRAFYEGKPFVRVVEHLPRTKDVTGTNFCDVTVRRARGRLIVLSVTDNLIKGAAGVAVQNMNLMCGWPETTALLP
jgi:N-acetyl-gamma-glutamyl-phosphate reductase